MIWKHFWKRGYAGYLKHDVDEQTGKVKETPGVTSLARSKEDLFGALRNYIELRGHKEKHLDFLIECRKIKGMEFMTKFDILTAVGLALLGSRSKHASMIEKMRKERYDVSGMFRTRNY